MAANMQPTVLAPTGQPTQDFYEYLKSVDKALRALAPAGSIKPMPPAQFAIVRVSTSDR